MIKCKRLFFSLISVLLIVSIIGTTASAAFVFEPTSSLSVLDEYTQITSGQNEISVNVFTEMTTEAQDIFLAYMQTSDPLLLEYHKKYVDPGCTLQYNPYQTRITTTDASALDVLSTRLDLIGLTSSVKYALMGAGSSILAAIADGPLVIGDIVAILKLYENVYHYVGDKIDRIERFNGRESFALWRVEFLGYQDGTIRKTVYLTHNVLSHYAICNILGGEIISKQIINPINGEYCWHLTSSCDDYCSIYVGEASLSSNVLSEILCYASSLKKPTIKYFLVIIECSDTLVDTSDKSLQNIENAYRERGIITQYSP